MLYSLFFSKFAYMNNDIANSGALSGNVIVVDADYVDKVAFDLIVNFERMIGRRIPPADMARWIDCVALDGGVREGANETQVVLIHDKKNSKMDNFAPSDYGAELNGKAFKDNLGEFALSSYPVESLVGKEDFFVEVLDAVCRRKEVKRLMVVRRQAHNRVRHAAHARRQLPPGDTRLFADERLGHKGRRA